MQIVFPIVFILIALKWGKWQNWKQYYPTMLFMMMGNLLYSFMFNNHPMWRFEHTFEEKLLPTSMSINVLKTFTTFPILILLFLSYFPEENTKTRKFLYILLWAFIFGLIEFIARHLHMISYHNGWNMWWSLLFDFVMFFILSVHYKRPVFAWVLSGVFVLFLWEIFNLSFEQLNQ